MNQENESNSNDEIIQIFLDEALQNLNDTEQFFLELESNPNNQELIDKIFRLAHNLKGSSRAVGFDELGTFTHRLESLLLKIKNSELAITSEIVSLLLRCNDLLKTWISELRLNNSYKANCSDLIAELENPQSILETQNSAPDQIPSNNDARFSEEIAPFNGEDFSALLASETQQQLENAQNKNAQDTKDFNPIPIEQAKKPQQIKPSTLNSNTPAVLDESIRISLGRVEKLINYVGELVIFQTVLRQQCLEDNITTIRKTTLQMSKVTKEVQELAMGLRMVPLKTTFQKMQRIVRDSSALLGKKVALSLEGEETEVDKKILEALGDPLVHIIRNAVDHGIESADVRVANGKSEIGNITLRAYHQGGKLILEVQDDGGGMSAEKLRAKAIEKGILNPNQVLSERECIHLIFHPGFSTKSEVSEISGRGVGMDVVKTNVEQLQGEVIVETSKGKGSVFKIVLPLTLAIIDGMVIKCGTEKFIIPLAHVNESLKPQKKDLQFATGVGEVLLLRGENLPVVRLSKILGRGKRNIEDTEQYAVIIRTQQRSFAALVDEIIGQYQVVIKKLGSELQHIKGYSGTAILGDGRPALILELVDLISNNDKPNLNLRQVS